jgi:hypothetical protein
MQGKCFNSSSSQATLLSEANANPMHQILLIIHMYRSSHYRDMGYGSALPPPLGC